MQLPYSVKNKTRAKVPKISYKIQGDIDKLTNTFRPNAMLKRIHTFSTLYEM